LGFRNLLSGGSEILEAAAMANRLEIAKFNTLLQNPRAIERFKTLFHQVQLLSLSHNIKATEGEVMAVCAYLTGRE
jgi:hypothetical protein